MNGWTPERRARQAQAIHNWKPWEQSSGPKTAEGRARASRNAWKGGHREQLRELTRMVNAQVREAQELIERL